MKRPRINTLLQAGMSDTHFQVTRVVLCLLKSSAKPSTSSFALGDGFVEIEAGVEFLMKSCGL